ncbi:MAG: exodeoxyribonuclease I [Candidatus Nomurabacteria bacterium]|jgi:exodeoxyribonuclease-1|nr:exodeoxyribonuclease I [Candidatus Nomurabacteria bacterium]
MTSFFFYDLETSGLNPRFDRVMQFAGIRTTPNLEPVGQPVNFLVKLSGDILPSPEALLVTGITPQMTLADGISEHEFARILSEEVFTPDTVAIGFNNIRFDDEFIRHTLWRNFYDPYEWSWANGRSRWDLLDVTRLTRALRPDGINWPTVDGKAVNKLELLAKANKIKQVHAHDALSDVEALIGLTRLIRQKQPKLFNYLYNLRDKKSIAELVNLDNPKPFTYASGRFQHPDKTTAAFPISVGRKAGSTLVYDLRFDPTQIDFNSEPELTWVDLPIKELQYNRCPAVAPLGVLDKAAQQRLELPLKVIQDNLSKLLKHRDIVDKLVNIWSEKPDFPPATDVEAQLYDGFVIEADRPRIQTVRQLDTAGLADFHPDFKDDRLDQLLLRYKAREFPGSLTKSEHETWTSFVRQKYRAELPKLETKLAELSKTHPDQQFILEELRLWAESNLPADDE